jgi:hypothetical protein
LVFFLQQLLDFLVSDEIVVYVEALSNASKHWKLPSSVARVP